MKKTFIIVACLIGLMLLVQTGIFDILLAFLLVGAIPGTSYSIPSGFMLLLITTCLWLLVLKFTPVEVKRAQQTKRRHTSSKSKKPLPRRRFSQI